MELLLLLTYCSQVEILKWNGSYEILAAGRQQLNAISVGMEYPTMCTYRVDWRSLAIRLGMAHLLTFLS